MTVLGGRDREQVEEAVENVTGGLYYTTRIVDAIEALPPQATNPTTELRRAITAFLADGEE